MLYRKFPYHKLMNLAPGLAIMAKYMKTFAEFELSSPKDRYLNL